MADRAPRDYSAMYERLDCRVCGSRVYAESHGRHAEHHLAAGEAIVVKAFGQPDRVVPTRSIPDEVERNLKQGKSTHVGLAELWRGRRARVVRGASFRPKED